ncbi:MAG: monothiol bacilliredoxin BrxC family protein [Mycobacterium leprae]
MSAAAHRAWAEFLQSAEAQRIEPAWVRVIEERPVSLHLAERIGVQHQSPQVILIQSGKALWHDSHRAITVDALKAAVHSVK